MSAESPILVIFNENTLHWQIDWTALYDFLFLDYKLSIIYILQIFCWSIRFCVLTEEGIFAPPPQDYLVVPKSWTFLYLGSTRGGVLGGSHSTPRSTLSLFKRIAHQQTILWLLHICITPMTSYYLNNNIWPEFAELLATCPISTHKFHTTGMDCLNKTYFCVNFKFTMYILS